MTVGGVRPQPVTLATGVGGLHTAIIDEADNILADEPLREAKEGIDLSDPTQTDARLSFQRFFPCTSNLAGMNGTLHGIEGKQLRIYGLLIVRIPPRLPSRRQILPDPIFATADEKWMLQCLLRSGRSALTLRVQKRVEVTAPRLCKRTLCKEPVVERSVIVCGEA